MPLSTASNYEYTTTNIPAFLSKLWTLVEDTKYDELIAWDQSGFSFHVFDQTRFAREILPRFFKHNNMASFIRQLNMYGFRKVNSIDHGSLKNEKEDMEFHHPYFIRGKEQFLEFIKRKVPDIKPNTNAVATTSVNQQNQNQNQQSALTVQYSQIKPEEINKVLDDVNIIKSKQKIVDDSLFSVKKENEALWKEIASLRQKHHHQQQIVNKLIHFLVHLVNPSTLGLKRTRPLMIDSHSANTLIDNENDQFVTSEINEIDNDDDEEYIVNETTNNLNSNTIKNDRIITTAINKSTNNIGLVNQRTNGYIEEHDDEDIDTEIKLKEKRKNNFNTYINGEEIETIDISNTCVQPGIKRMRNSNYNDVYNINSNNILTNGNNISSNHTNTISKTKEQLISQQNNTNNDLKNNNHIVNGNKNLKFAPHANFISAVKANNTYNNMNTNGTTNSIGLQKLLNSNNNTGVVINEITDSYPNHDSSGLKAIVDSSEKLFNDIASNKSSSATTTTTPLPVIDLADDSPPSNGINFDPKQNEIELNQSTGTNLNNEQNFLDANLFLNTPNSSNAESNNVIALGSANSPIITTPASSPVSNIKSVASFPNNNSNNTVSMLLNDNNGGIDLTPNDIVIPNNFKRSISNSFKSSSNEMTNHVNSLQLDLDSIKEFLSSNNSFNQIDMYTINNLFSPIGLDNLENEQFYLEAPITSPLNTINNTVATPNTTTSQPNSHSNGNNGKIIGNDFLKTC